MALILIIEDDPHIGPRLKRTLELSGFHVRLAPDGRSGMTEALKGAADLILLDLMLPEVDGLHILRQLRMKNSQLPVIILTAKGSEVERLEGFRAGCDDYVCKPFSLPELLERIRAVLRRSGYREMTPSLYSAGITIDPDARTADIKGEPLSLIAREFDLLYTLIAHTNRTLSRDFLLNEVWGVKIEVTHRTVDAHIANLRRKLKQAGYTGAIIETAYKVGYKWAVK